MRRFDGRHPLSGYEPHGHRFYELLYLERARGEHRVGGQRAPVREGDLLVIAPRYFIRPFRRVNGMTPRRWRKAHR